MAVTDDDDAIAAGLEALRSRHGGGGRGGNTNASRSTASNFSRRPGSGKVSALKRATSSAALMTAGAVAVPDTTLQPSELKKMAVDSVQTQLIQSLDRDCRAYRAQIEKLTQKLEDQHLSPPPPPTDAIKSLEDEVARLRTELEASHREREALVASVGRLSREKSNPMQQLALAEEQLAKARAEREDLKAQLARSEEQLGAAWRAAKDAESDRDAAAARRAQEHLGVEARLAEAEKKRAEHARAETAVRAELAEARGATEEARAKLARTEEELALAQAAAQQATLEAYEAKGESSNLARRLAGMAERKEERDKKAALEERNRLKGAAEQAQGALRSEVSGLKSEMSGLRAENTRANDLVKALRAKLLEAANAPQAELASLEKEAAKARKASERAERHAMQLEAANNQLTAENLKLRSAADDAKAEADAAKAKAEVVLATSGAPAVRDAPKETLAPMGGGAVEKQPSNFGKFQAKVKALEEENEQLKAQLVAALQQRQQRGSPTKRGAR